MAANSSLQITSLDFDIIKENFKTFLKSQTTLQDYNYEGSALSVLMDLLAYNTQYNAFYLNMIANEMFLDTAIRRSSVVSQAKLLNYVPKSAIAPSATVQLIVNQVSDSSLTLPKYTNFLSEAIDGINYNFVTVDSQTVNVISNIATFNNVKIKQGTPLSATYTVDSTTNPHYIFNIPDTNVDTSTLSVTVQPSASNTYFDVYNLATGYSNLNNSSLVYFLQENLDGGYQIYFGDGILGNQLIDGNYIKINYISTNGTAAAGANNFILMDTVSGYANTILHPITSASAGGNQESIDSIKFQAPKTYAAQGRAVTKDDYITAIQQNTLGYSFDAVNVWGGEENDPPIYGQVFISMKPTGAYVFTDTQKQSIVQNVIKPISVLTVQPTIVDPDYIYIQVFPNVLYDTKKTTNSAQQLQALITHQVYTFATNTLNTFNSTFNEAELVNQILSVDPSIIACEIKIRLQKKFYPSTLTTTTYNLYYNTELQKGVLTSGLNSYPELQFRDPSNLSNIITNVYLEESPSLTNGVDTINIINPGFGYQIAPTVTILGDGTGATAVAVINANGTLKQIEVTNAGTGYTSAIAVITPQSQDTTGQLAAATVSLQGRYGTIRSYYNNTQNVKVILNNNIGTIDYLNGVVTLNSFNPYGTGDPLGELVVGVIPVSSIISSQYNQIITIDPFDSTAVIVSITGK